MMIAVRTGQEAEFDAIWNWERPTCPHGRSIFPPTDLSVDPWKDRNGMPNDECRAGRGGVHGDVTYFAAARWAMARAFNDYRAEADRRLE